MKATAALSSLSAAIASAQQLVPVSTKCIKEYSLSTSMSAGAVTTQLVSVGPSAGMTIWLVAYRQVHGNHSDQLITQTIFAGPASSTGKGDSYITIDDKASAIHASPKTVPHSAVSTITQALAPTGAEDLSSSNVHMESAASVLSDSEAAPSTVLLEPHHTSANVIEGSAVTGPPLMADTSEDILPTRSNQWASIASSSIKGSAAYIVTAGSVVDGFSSSTSSDQLAPFQNFSATRAFATIAPSGAALISNGDFTPVQSATENSAVMTAVSIGVQLPTPEPAPFHNVTSSSLNSAASMRISQTSSTELAPFQNSSGTVTRGVAAPSGVLATPLTGSTPYSSSARICSGKTAVSGVVALTSSAEVAPFVNSSTTLTPSMIASTGHVTFVSTRPAPFHDTNTSVATNDIQSSGGITTASPSGNAPCRNSNTTTNLPVGTASSGMIVAPTSDAAPFSNTTTPLTGIESTALGNAPSLQSAPFGNVTSCAESPSNVPSSGLFRSTPPSPAPFPISNVSLTVAVPTALTGDSGGTPLSTVGALSQPSPSPSSGSRLVQSLATLGTSSSSRMVCPERTAAGVPDHPSFTASSLGPFPLHNQTSSAVAFMPTRNGVIEQTSTWAQSKSTKVPLSTPPLSQWTMTYSSTGYTTVTVSHACSASVKHCAPHKTTVPSIWRSTSTKNVTPTITICPPKYSTKTHTFNTTISTRSSRIVTPTTVRNTWTIPGSTSWVFSQPPTTAWAQNKTTVTCDRPKYTPSTIWATTCVPISSGTGTVAWTSTYSSPVFTTSCPVTVPAVGQVSWEAVSTGAIPLQNSTTDVPTQTSSKSWIAYIPSNYSDSSPSAPAPTLPKEWTTQSLSKVTTNLTTWITETSTTYPVVTKVMTRTSNESLSEASWQPQRHSGVSVPTTAWQTRVEPSVPIKPEPTLSATALETAMPRPDESSSTSVSDDEVSGEGSWYKTATTTFVSETLQQPPFELTSSTATSAQLLAESSLESPVELTSHPLVQTTIHSLAKPATGSVPPSTRIPELPSQNAPGLLSSTTSSSEELPISPTPYVSTQSPLPEGSFTQPYAPSAESTEMTTPSHTASQKEPGPSYVSGAANFEFILLGLTLPAAVALLL